MQDRANKAMTDMQPAIPTRGATAEQTAKDEEELAAEVGKLQDDIRHAERDLCDRQQPARRPGCATARRRPGRSRRSGASEQMAG